jgi:hypothetical protein
MCLDLVCRVDHVGFLLRVYFLVDWLCTLLINDVINLVATDPKTSRAKEDLYCQIGMATFMVWV